MTASRNLRGNLMSLASRILTYAAVALALFALAREAKAVTCLGALPAASIAPGWSIMADSTRSGRMGSKTSYDAYDGAVEELQSKGIVAFAQRMYRNASTGQYVTVDVYELASKAAASNLYAAKLSESRKAKPLIVCTTIKDKAFVGTLGSISLGCCTRGKYLCEVTMTKAQSSQHRTTVRKFVSVISGKLAP
ncbi:MAG: hypothetical protein HPY44_21050 [Armatimonadetes bacterium]|nr:hypothetical protein [Armatimonadota bacterium]